MTWIWTDYAPPQKCNCHRCKQVTRAKNTAIAAAVMLVVAMCVRVWWIYSAVR